jgi:hypothetical protein
VTRYVMRGTAALNITPSIAMRGSPWLIATDVKRLAAFLARAFQHARPMLSAMPASAAPGPEPSAINLMASSRSRAFVPGCNTAMGRRILSSS